MKHASLFPVLHFRFPCTPGPRPVFTSGSASGSTLGSTSGSTLGSMLKSVRTALVLLLLCGSFFSTQAASPLTYTTQGTARVIPLSSLAGVHLPMTVQEILAEKESYLELSPVSESAVPRYFRVCLASNLTAPAYLLVRDVAGEELFRMDIGLGSFYQWFQQELSPELWTKMNRGPVRIYLESEQVQRVRLIVRCPQAHLFEPHLVTAAKLPADQQFLTHFASLNSINSYGWQSGCILDGLASLAESKTYGRLPIYREMLQEHLRLCFPEGVSKKLTSIENTPSIAQLARWNPQHPELQRTLDFWNSRRDAQGGIHGSKAVAEGCYTVAWPLAVMAKQWHRPDLAEDAILQLRIRRDRLIDSAGLIWLRHDASGQPERTYRMWSRGITWYFLGLAKTLDVLDHPPVDLIQEYQRTAALVLKYQNSEGVWHLFADDPTTAYESSGTAGIAAAWAIGLRRGWIDRSYRTPLTRAVEGFRKHFLTEDGLVKGVAPNNKAQGGEPFQRASKGMMLQFGMGLYALCIAECDGLR